MPFSGGQFLDDGVSSKEGPAGTGLEILQTLLVPQSCLQHSGHHDQLTFPCEMGPFMKPLNKDGTWSREMMAANM